MVHQGIALFSHIRTKGVPVESGTDVGSSRPGTKTTTVMTTTKTQDHREKHPNGLSRPSQWYRQNEQASAASLARRYRVRMHGQTLGGQRWRGESTKRTALRRENSGRRESSKLKTRPGRLYPSEFTYQRSCGGHLLLNLLVIRIAAGVDNDGSFGILSKPHRPGWSGLLGGMSYTGAGGNDSMGHAGSRYEDVAGVDIVG